MKRINRLQKNNPELLSDGRVVELAEQGDKLHDLKVLAQSDGGKELVKLLLQDVVSVIGTLRATYRTATHAELLASIATVDARLSVIQLLARSDTNLKIVDEMLEEALSE